MRDVHNNTPLHNAARNGALEIVKYYIKELNCDQNIGGQGGKSLLHQSSGRGYLNVVKYLVEECHCDPLLLADDEVTPLHNASAGGRLEVVKYLIAVQGCDPLIRDSDGTTPLHYAAMHGKLEVVRLYIQDLNCDPNIGDWDYQTPFNYACVVGHVKVMQYLSSIAANPYVLLHSKLSHQDKSNISLLSQVANKDDNDEMIKHTFKQHLRASNQWFLVRPVKNIHHIWSWTEQNAYISVSLPVISVQMAFKLF